MQQNLIKTFAVPTALLHSEAEHNIYKVMDHKAQFRNNPEKIPFNRIILAEEISGSFFLKF